MSKNIMIALVVIVLALGGYYYTQGDQIAIEPKDSMMVKTDDNKMKGESKRYLPYTPEVLAQSSETRRVLYFYASWCPTCIPASADLEKNTSILPSDVTVIRVNYSDPDTDADEKALAAKYNITYQHTFVQIDSSGKEIVKWNGGATKELLGKIK